MRRYTKAIEGYVKNNRLFLTIVTACLVTGVCVGAGLCVSMGTAQSDEIAGYLTDFSQLTQQAAPDTQAIFASAMAGMLQLGLFLWLCGLTRLGLPVAPAIVSVRGFMCGFTVAALIRNFETVGLLAAAVGILPQMLILLPCMVVFAVSAMNHATLPRSVEGADRRRRFAAYTVAAALLLMAFALCAIVESYVSPFAIRWALSLY